MQYYSHLDGYHAETHAIAVLCWAVTQNLLNEYIAH